MHPHPYPSFARGVFFNYVDLCLGKEYYNIRKNLIGVVAMPKKFSDLEHEFLKAYPHGPTDEDINKFCKEYTFLRCSKRKAEFIKYIFRKD